MLHAIPVLIFAFVQGAVTSRQFFAVTFMVEEWGAFLYLSW
jgi:hypothetical protein